MNKPEEAISTITFDGLFIKRAMKNVILQEGSSKAIETFKKAMLKCPEVSQCYYVTGTYDFELIVNTRDMRHFEEFQKKNLLGQSQSKAFLYPCCDG